MTVQRESADATQAARVPDDKQPKSQVGHAVPQPNRRRALRMLSTLAAATAAAALTASRPEQASADTLGTFSSSTGTAAVTAINTGSGDGIYGSASNSNGLEGSTATGQTSVNGPAGVVGWTNANAGIGVIGQANGGGGFGIWGQAANGIGVKGSGTSYGVTAISSNSNGTGVDGSGGTSSGGTGVVGRGFMGVFGIGSSIGVYGDGIGGVGVQGTSSSSSNSIPGVYGINTGGGPAIVGFSPSGDGFSAVTATGTGCFGGASGSGTGIYAYSVNGTALSALAGGGGNIAGYFGGPVIINGALSVMGAKSAAVRAADGKLRRLYSLESPESWFEDFGRGELKGGSATIQLEPGFAGVVHGDDYHVFLTPEGELKGPLYLSSKKPSGFTVQESGGGTSNVGFSYRIVAKRKDIAGARLEQVDEPPVPEVPIFPTPPMPPPMPRIPAGH